MLELALHPAVKSLFEQAMTGQSPSGNRGDVLGAITRFWWIKVAVGGGWGWGILVRVFFGIVCVGRGSVEAEVGFWNMNVDMIHGFWNMNVATIFSEMENLIFCEPYSCWGNSSEN